MTKELLKLYNSKKEAIIENLKQFSNRSEQDMLREHLFCILTPQSNGKLCWEAVEIIEKEKATTPEKIASILRGKARFHHTKAMRYIKAKSEWSVTRKLIETPLPTRELRNKIAEHVNGYGLKEAGHFLRNIGRSNNEIAILDRHILRNLQKHGAFKGKEAKLKGNKSYLELEQQALEFSQKTGIPIDHLDLLFWHVEHGEFFK
jgi:N-glycosylase/DNA lyase